MDAAQFEMRGEFPAAQLGGGVAIEVLAIRVQHRDGGDE